MPSFTSSKALAVPTAQSPVVISVSDKPRKRGGYGGKLRAIAQEAQDRVSSMGKSLRRAKQAAKAPSVRLLKLAAAGGVGYALGEHVGSVEGQGGKLPTLPGVDVTYAEAGVGGLAVASTAGAFGKLNEYAEAAAAGGVAVLVYERTKAAARAREIAKKAKK